MRFNEGLMRGRFFLGWMSVGHDSFFTMTSVNSLGRIPSNLLGICQSKMKIKLCERHIQIYLHWIFLPHGT